ncbi:beta family protein [Escherichia albertii]|uniref:beta family protein n=1 Tax=Escherichia albertii TaxID=208962 RepID=UPI0039BFC7FA
MASFHSFENSSSLLALSSVSSTFSSSSLPRWDSVTAVKGNGWGQTKNLCTTLVSSPEYQVFGSKFSWGDDYIYQRSLGANKSGGSKEWRKVAHTHHITLVVRQLYWLAQTQPAKP